MLNEKILSGLMKNKKVKELVGQMSEVAAILMGFAQTYLGVYDKEGNQIEKGDRDYIFETLDEIVKKLEKLEKDVEEIKQKL